MWALWTISTLAPSFAAFHFRTWLMLIGHSRRCHLVMHGEEGETERERESESQRVRESESQRERERVRESESQRVRESESQRVRETESQRERESQTERERQTERGSQTEREREIERESQIKIRKVAGQRMLFHNTNFGNSPNVALTAASCESNMWLASIWSSRAYRKKHHEKGMLRHLHVKRHKHHKLQTTHRREMKESRIYIIVYIYIYYIIVYIYILYKCIYISINVYIYII